MARRVKRHQKGVRKGTTKRTRRRRRATKVEQLATNYKGGVAY